MPYDAGSQIGEGLAQLGAGIGEGLVLRRKRQKEEEEKRRKAFLLLLQGKAAGATQELADHPDLKAIAEADPDKLSVAIQTAQERNKAKAATAQEDQQRTAYNVAAGVGRDFGPTSPETENNAEMAAKVTPLQSKEMVDKLAVRDQDGKRQQIMQGLAADPSRKASISETSFLFPDAPDKWYKYANKSLAEIQAEDAKGGDPDAKWKNDIAIRKRARTLVEGGKQTEADQLLQDYGLSLGDSGVVGEKQMREWYGRYYKNAENQRLNPDLGILLSSGAMSATPEQRGPLIEKQLGPIKTLGEWLSSPEALQLNPQLATKLKTDYDSRMQKVSELWQLEKFDTTPDEFMKMLDKAEDIKPYLDDLTKTRIRSMLQ